MCADVVDAARELAQLGECLLVVGDLSCLWDGVNDLPAHDAVFVDDERATGSDAHLVIEDTVGPRHLAVRPEVSEQCEIEMIPVRPCPRTYVESTEMASSSTSSRVTSGNWSRIAQSSPVQTPLKASG